MHIFRAVHSTPRLQRTAETEPVPMPRLDRTLGPVCTFEHLDNKGDKTKQGVSAAEIIPAKDAAAECPNPLTKTIPTLFVLRDQDNEEKESEHKSSTNSAGEDSIGEYKEELLHKTLPCTTNDASTRQPHASCTVQ